MRMSLLEDLTPADIYDPPRPRAKVMGRSSGAEGGGCNRGR
jgi:hypothetical protein